MERDRTHCISNTPVHSLELVAPTLLWYASGTKGAANMHAIGPRQRLSQPLAWQGCTLPECHPVPPA